MQVFLSTPTFDPAGTVALQVLPASTFGETRRRMNRVATLDGGAVFNDFGYSQADRTLVLKWQVTSAAQEAQVDRLVQTYAQLQVATPRGFYLCGVEVYAPGDTESSLTLLVAEKKA